MVKKYHEPPSRVWGFGALGFRGLANSPSMSFIGIVVPPITIPTEDCFTASQKGEHPKFRVLRFGAWGLVFRAETLQKTNSQVRSSWTLKTL